MRQVIGAAIVFLCVYPILAETKGQGYLVTADQINVYAKAEGDKVIRALKRGEGLVAIRTGYLGEKLPKGPSNGWTEQEKKGRLHVEFPGPSPHANQTWETQGWIDRDGVVAFRYECGCGPEDNSCDPFIHSGLFGAKWNPCFVDGRDNKASSANVATERPTVATPKESVEERLEKLNGLLKKGLITKEEFDTKKAEILKDM